MGNLQYVCRQCLNLASKNTLGGLRLPTVSNRRDWILHPGTSYRQFTSARQCLSEAVHNGGQTDGAFGAFVAALDGTSVSKTTYKPHHRQLPQATVQVPNSQGYEASNMSRRPGKRRKPGRRDKAGSLKPPQTQLTAFKLAKGEAWTPAKVDQFFSYMNHIQASAATPAATQLWLELKESLGVGDTLSEEDRSKIFARFLRVLFQVRQATHAIDVWNHMVKIQHPIERRHWNAMISGCANIRDYTSLEDIWRSLAASGLAPDNELWTSYIYGTMKCEKVEHGLKCLDALSRQWRSSKYEIEPSLGPVHGAMSGLLESGLRSLKSWVPHVFKWSHQQGLRPTTQTYNILLQAIIPYATTDTIQQHLQACTSDNCPPDIFTYNIIARTFIASPKSTFHDLPSSTQIDVIANLLADMKDQNISPTPETYSTLFHAVLPTREDQQTPNPEAAQLILDNMAAAGIRPSQHLMTILLGYYFATKPPNLAAVDRLVQVLHLAPSASNPVPELSAVPASDFFWNRLIAGYANCNEYEKALLHLRRLLEAGMAPSWITMTHLLASLRRAGEWGLAREVVDGVEVGDTMRWGGTGVDGTGWARWVALVAELRGGGVLQQPEGNKNQMEDEKRA